MYSVFHYKKDQLCGKILTDNIVLPDDISSIRYVYNNIKEYFPNIDMTLDNMENTQYIFRSRVYMDPDGIKCKILQIISKSNSSENIIESFIIKKNKSKL